MRQKKTHCTMSRTLHTFCIFPPPFPVLIWSRRLPRPGTILAALAALKYFRPPLALLSMRENRLGMWENAAQGAWLGGCHKGSISGLLLRPSVRSGLTLAAMAAAVAVAGAANLLRFHPPSCPLQRYPGPSPLAPALKLLVAGPRTWCCTFPLQPTHQLLVEQTGAGSERTIRQNDCHVALVI